MDDLAIGAHSSIDLDHKVHLVLQWFCDLGLSLKLSKCDFNKMEVKFLGMILRCGCICMDPAKLSAIATWPPPKSVKAVCALLGFCNFYRKFIPNFSNLVAPLTVKDARMMMTNTSLFFLLPRQAILMKRPMSS